MAALSPRHGYAISRKNGRPIRANLAQAVSEHGTMEGTEVGGRQSNGTVSCSFV